MSRSGFTSYVFGFGLVLLGALTTLRGTFTHTESAVQVLQRGGYGDIRITRRITFLAGARGCDPMDAARYDATAIDPKGAPVAVYVCLGWPVGEPSIHIQR